MTHLASKERTRALRRAQEHGFFRRPLQQQQRALARGKRRHINLLNYNLSSSSSNYCSNNCDCSNNNSSNNHNIRNHRRRSSNSNSTIKSA